MQHFQALNDTTLSAQSGQLNQVYSNEGVFEISRHGGALMGDSNGKDDTLMWFFRRLYLPHDRSCLDGPTIENCHSDGIGGTVESDSNVSILVGCVSDTTPQNFPSEVGVASSKFDSKDTGVYTPITANNLYSDRCTATNTNFPIKETVFNPLDVSNNVGSSAVTQSSPLMPSPPIEEFEPRIGTGAQDNSASSLMLKVYPPQEIPVLYSTGMPYPSAGKNGDSKTTSISQLNTELGCEANSNVSPPIIHEGQGNFTFIQVEQQIASGLNKRQGRKTQFGSNGEYQKAREKRKHSKKAPKPRGRKPSAVTDSDKSFVCSDCKARFKRLEHLTRHTQSLHSGEKPYNCPMCQRGFSRSDNMKLHLKRHSNSSKVRRS